MKCKVNCKYPTGGNKSAPVPAQKTNPCRRNRNY